MGKDRETFRKRFLRWKNGEKVYDNGVPAAILEVDKSDADFAKRLRSNWRLEIWDWEGTGKSATHKISSSDNIVYPNVQTTEGGGLIDFTNPVWNGVVDPRLRAILHGDFVPMKTESDAIWFGPNYKKYYPGFKNGKSVSEIYDAGLPRYGGGKSKINWKRWDDAQTTSYTIPFILDKAITLTNAGRATGARLSTNLLDSLADNAIRAGVPVRTAVGLATKESTLGNPTDDRSAWNLSSGIRKLFNDVYPGTSQYINQGRGLNEREDVINYHKGHLSDTATEGKSVIQEGLEFYKQHPDRYNPGQPGYQKAVEARGNEVMKSPEVLKWYKEWEDSKVQVKRPEPYKILTNFQNTAAPKFGKYANGKLPLFKDGDIPYITSDGVLYNINPNVVGAEQLNVRVPEVVVTGTDRRPMYQRYAAEHSVYDPEAIRNLTDWAPIVGDIGQGLDAYNAFKNQNYLLAGVLGGMLLLPNALEKPGKALLKAGLKYAPNITKNVYDISKLYTKIEDNPRLRRYANDVADLLNSDQISERVAKSVDNVDIAKQISNISNTPIAFSHANKLWIRPTITLEPLGLNYKFISPIPIQMRAAGLYDPVGKKTFIKRNGRTPEQIKLTTYHETSHASDNASPKDVGIDFYDRNTHVEGKNAYFDLATEKRARLMSILTDAYKHGVDINNKSAIEEFITSPNYTNHNLNSLLENYNYIFDKADDFYNLLDNGFKDGKLPMFKNGKSPIHIKPANRGKFTALKKRTGHSASWFKENGTPEQKKMAIFALNAKKWKH